MRTGAKLMDLIIAIVNGFFGTGKQGSVGCFTAE